MAGAGGCLLFYVPPAARESVRRAMRKDGLREIPIRLEPSGTTIIHASDWAPADEPPARRRRRTQSSSAR